MDLPSENADFKKLCISEPHPIRTDLSTLRCTDGPLEGVLSGVLMATNDDDQLLEVIEGNPKLIQLVILRAEIERTTYMEEVDYIMTRAILEDDLLFNWANDSVLDACRVWSDRKRWKRVAGNDFIHDFKISKNISEPALRFLLKRLPIDHNGILRALAYFGRDELLQTAIGVVKGFTIRCWNTMSQDLMNFAVSAGHARVLEMLDRSWTLHPQAFHMDIALCRRHADVIRFLVKKGIPVPKGTSAAGLQLLLDCDAPLENDLLIEAIKNVSLEKVEMLLKRGLPRPDQDGIRRMVIPSFSFQKNDPAFVAMLKMLETHQVQISHP